MRIPRFRLGRRASVSALALTVALTLAACGSNLGPDEVVGLGQMNTTATPDGTPVDNGVPGTDTGTGTGADTGTDTDTGTGARANTGKAEAPGEVNDPDSGAKAGSCDGFDNDQVGVTKDTIQLVNVADISGPVPGLFESAQQATRAFIEYFNSTSKICGHKLALDLLDSRADAGAEQQAYASACDKAFAAVGSMSAFDSGGAATAANCGIPDIRSTSASTERNKCATCFSTQAVTPHLIPSAVPKFFLGKYKEAASAAGLLYINAGAAAPTATFMKNAFVRAGWKVPYFQGIDVAEFNFAPYVQQMKDKGVKMVVYMGPYQNTVKIQQAMQQQGFDAMFLQDSSIYDQGYVEQAGSLGDGTFAHSTTELFDANIPEMKLYRAWLEQVSPGATPNFFGLYAWSAARLFVQEAVELGGKLTRASLIASVKQVKHWTSNGIHAPQQVGSKIPANCVKIIQLNGGIWKKVSGGDWLCSPLIDAS